MKIYGMQKLTLIDYPGKVAATVFLGGCNFRCPFCQNSPLVTSLDPATATDENDLIPLFSKRKGILDGVCISGGEPLLSNESVDFIRRIKAMGYSVKLDTNGGFPKKLKTLVNEGSVDYVAMDIKNCLDRYGETAGIAPFDSFAVEESADFLLHGTVEYEFRTTVVKEFHTTEDIKKMGERFKGAKRWYLQTFVDSGCVIREGLHGYDKPKMEEFRQILAQFSENAILREV